MYIIEFIIKKFKEKKQSPEVHDDKEEFRCNHVFMPIDSTGEYLACKYCGVLIKKDDLKKYKKQD